MKKPVKIFIKSIIAAGALSIMCAVAACSSSGEAKAPVQTPITSNRSIGKKSEEALMHRYGEEHNGRRRPPVLALPETHRMTDGEADETLPQRPPMPRGAIMFLIVPAPGAFDFLPPPPKDLEPETEQSGENNAEEPATEQTGESTSEQPEQAQN